ncbi:inositol monophosphatase family protein [Timonella sp. A28]|uniref:inositol monophosphatase family protein n=1 Tax=Timonella sp. A28 TaxID=3442640 RepID=UPI003EB6A8C1
MRPYNPQPGTRAPLELVSELAKICELLAEEARDFILSHKPVKAAVLETKSTPTDVVTQMDKDVESLLRARLADVRPDDGFLGEESEAVTSRSGLTWVIDPIDGTVNYLYGLPAYSVSIAVVQGEPNPTQWTQLAGCVIRVPDGTRWVAGKGLGALKNGEPIRVNRPHSLGACLAGTGFGYDERVRAMQADVLCAVLPQVRDIRRMGSAAIDLCSVADGTLDVYFERGLSPWDMAAGSLIAGEAGALVCGLDEGRPTKTMTLAGSADRVGELAAILRSAHADRELD